VFAAPRGRVKRLGMLRRFPPRIRIPGRVADDAHHIIDLARGSLSGDPYDPTTTQAYGKIIESIREPSWGKGLIADPQIKFAIGLGRHMVADTCLLYAAAQTIAADRDMHMAEALRLLDAAIDDMAAGRPVTPRLGRRHTRHGHRDRHDCDMPTRGRGHEAQRLWAGNRQHGSREHKILSSH
jgi:hypothetical protein